jgi:hypothetical protein
MTAVIVAPVPTVEGEVVGNGFFLESNPFRVGSLRYIEGVPEGATLAEYAAAAQRVLPHAYRDHLQIWVGEHRIDPAYWAGLRPKPAVPVYVRVRPQGKGGKNILRALVLVAIIAVAFYFLGPMAPIWGSVVTLGETVLSAVAIAAVSMIATMAINALIPPPGLTGMGDSKDPRYQLTGSSNRYVPYGPIPRIFGKLKVFPLLGGRPFTENVGKHQYLRMLLCVGWGPLRISDIRIGNSPITGFKNTEVEIHEGGPDGWAGNRTITLYNRRVQEQSLTLELLRNVASPFQTTALNTVEIEVDISFPYGLIEYKDDGNRKSRTVEHRVQYRAVGAGTWINAPLIDTDEIRVKDGGILVSKEKSPDSVRHTARWKVPSGQYEVQIIRLSVAGLNPSPATGDVEMDRSYWTTLRSFSTDQAFVQKGVCLIAIRMQATDQLNGVPDTISCVAESYLPVYSATQTLDDAELVVNGTGDAVSGWTELNAGRSLLTSVGGLLRITRPPSVADSQAWYQDIAVTAGQTYRLRGKLYPHGDNKARIALVNGSTTTYAYETIGATLDTTFVAAGASVRIRLEAADAVGTWIVDDNYAEFDNISVIRQTTAAGWNFAITQNPAWAFADVLRRRAGLPFLADDRLDTATILDWATECDAAPPSGSDAHRWTFNAAIEGGSVYESLKQIAAIGRASYTLRDGLHSVVRDKVQATPVQHITPRNSWGYSGTRIYADLPHALRVEFVNKDAEYRVDERIVYADGYDVNTADRFEVLQLFGCTSKDLAFREARYHLAVGTLRPEEHKISMDVENLRCTLGDRVQLSHDVIAVGKGWGRIKSLLLSGANTIGFALDDQVEFDNGHTFQLRCREADGQTSIRTVTPAPGAFNLLSYSEQFGNAAWTKQNSATVTANATTDPDGAAGGDKLVSAAATNAFAVYEQMTTRAVPYTASIYAKAAGANWLWISLFDSGSVERHVWFNLAAGTVGTAESGCTGAIEAVGNGWYRCSLRLAVGFLGAGNTLRYGMAGADASTSFVGNGSNGIYLWGAQLEEATSAGAYVEAGPHPAYSSGTYNLSLNSEDFTGRYTYGVATVTGNAAIAPDGTMTADKLVTGVANNIQGVLTGTSYGEGTFTVSVYAKFSAVYWRIWLGAYDGVSSYPINAEFDIRDGRVTFAGPNCTARIEDVGDGWYRCSATATYGPGTDAGATSAFPVWISNGVPGAGFAGDGVNGVFLWGLQIVCDDQPGYYVKTGGAAAQGGFIDTVACSAEATSGGPAAGDVFMFGVTGIESLPAMVKKIEPGDDLSAVLTLVPYDAAIYTADTGAIPAFNSYLEGDFDRTRPSAPAITLRSDFTAADVTSAGTTIRLAVDIAGPTSSRIPLDGFEVRYRLTGSVDWSPWPGLQQAFSGTVYITPVVIGQIYQVAARSKGVNGLFSDWIQAADHTIIGNSLVPRQPTFTSLAVQTTGNLATWTNPTSADLRGVQLWQNRSNSFTGAVKVGETLAGQLLHSPTYPGDIFYYWLVSVNNSGTSSAPLAIGSLQTPEAAGIGGGDNVIDGGGGGGFGGAGWDLKGWRGININPI